MLETEKYKILVKKSDMLHNRTLYFFTVLSIKIKVCKMKTKKNDIELPFETSMLVSDLKEIKENLQEAVDSPDCPEEITLLLGVVENLQDMVKKTKDPENADLSTKISFIAHFTLLQDLINMLQPDDGFDDEDDFEDDEEFDEDEELELEENEK